jgi:hypothetical protein
LVSIARDSCVSEVENEIEEKIPISTKITNIEDIKHPKHEANIKLKKDFII